jgi:hypothetical protein
VAVVHCVRLLLAEFDGPFTFYDLFGDDWATLVSLNQQERVISPFIPVPKPDQPIRLLGTNSWMVLSMCTPNVSHGLRLSQGIVSSSAPQA